jgi:hypothetical protein
MKNLLHVVLLSRKGDWGGPGPAEDDGNAAAAFSSVPQGHVGVGWPREDCLPHELSDVSIVRRPKFPWGDTRRPGGDRDALEVGLAGW